MTDVNRLGAGEICRLEFDVEFPPGHAAAYLVPAAEPLLVDAGTLGSAGEDALAAGLGEYGYETADVTHVLVTHPHVDHVGQLAHLREVADPTIHAPTTFEPFLRRDVADVADASRATLREAGVDDDTIERLVPEFRKSEAIIRDVLPPSAIDHWIEPGEPTEVGPLGAVDPIHAPGHHQPHVCYATRLGEERVMFSGDMVIEPFRAATIHTGLDEGVADGIEAFRTALDRLAGESVDRVFPGHGPVHGDYQAAIDRSTSDLADRVEASASRIRPDGSTALHVAGNLSSDERDVARLIPEVIAALATLERAGRARSRLVDGVRYYEPV